ncbi:MAG: alpha/beta hydrolase family esterase [Beijerinckiaceae bacterium]
MKQRLRPGMLEATRLTRAGRLIEATELLQRLFRDEAAADTTTDNISSTMNAPGSGVSRIDAAAPRTDEVTDREVTDRQPSLRTCWRSGRAFLTGARGRSAGKAASAAQVAAPKAPQAAAEPRMPEALRSFIERINGMSFETGRQGPLARPPVPKADLVPDGGQFIKGSYSNQAGSRAYKLFIPSGYHGQALPLIVMLHGCNQSHDDFAAGTRMNELAEEHTCFVAYPAQSASANFSMCWNWFRPGHQHRGEGEPSLIAGITSQIMLDYSVDARRVYVAGLSAGAAAAAIMGMTYPDLYAAIGVHSGLIHGAASDLRSAFGAMRGKPAAVGAQFGGTWGAGGDGRVVPTIVFHGDRDRTVHPCNGDQVIAQSTAPATKDLRTRVEHGRVPGGHAYSRTIHADARGKTILEQWVIEGAGHAWSGGSGDGSYTDPRGPDASREMLRFFLEHRHPAVRRV